ncbi:hypothetical protein ACFV46_10160 [Streptomyces sp. NPDC059852]
MAEIDGSTDTAVWLPLADLRDDAILSPPAVDALGMLERVRETLGAPRAG